jgi:hypothetical protein
MKKTLMALFALALCAIRRQRRRRHQLVNGWGVYDHYAQNGLGRR